MSPHLRRAALGVAALLAACTEPTAPAVFEGGVLALAAPAPAENCTFGQGTTTCVRVEQSFEDATHSEVSGCLYGPTGIPSARLRTYADVLLVTTTTTTLAHGLAGAVYDTSVSVVRQLYSSRLISDVCQPPG